MPLHPVVADYEPRVRESFAKQKVMALFGATISRVAPGEVDITMPFKEDLTQQHGFVHAGVVTTLADSACGYAALTLMPKNVAVLSAEFKINLIAPADGDKVIARASVLKAGRTLSVCLAHVFVTKEGRERLVATLLGTMMTVKDRAELQD